MQLVRLYGKGAAIFHHGKDVIRAENGVLDVPALLVPQALAMGFTTEQRGPAQDDAPMTAQFSKEELAEGKPADFPYTPLPVQDAFRSVQDRIALYEKEAREAGYIDDAVTQIVQERLRFDELIDTGMSEEDAAATVWGGKKDDAVGDAGSDTKAAAPTPEAPATPE